MDGTLAFSFAAEVERDEVSERAFIPWRLPASALAQGLIDEVIDDVVAQEKQRGLRRRQRKAVDLERFRQAISAIICDTAVSLLTEANRPLYLSRSHQDLGSGSRYVVPTSTRKLPHILDLLASQELAILVQRIGGGWEDGFRGRTTISAGKGLIERVSSLGLGPEDFRVRPVEETIILKRRKKDYWDQGDYQEYRDTEVTLRFRAEMTVINERLAAANISLQHEALKVMPDITDRGLRRVFTQGRFDCGGRLFGGFWQTMRKADRFAGLRLDGEPVAEIDFGQMMARLVYAHCGVEPEMEDLYDIPTLEGCRPGTKKVASAMLFADKELQRFPKGTRKLFPDWMDIGFVTEAITDAHPRIAHLFGTGIGHHCQFLESQILIRVLNNLDEHRVTALPIHDAILVPRSKSEQAAEAMLRAFREETGFEGRVEVKLQP